MSPLQASMFLVQARTFPVQPGVSPAQDGEFWVGEGEFWVGEGEFWVGEGEFWVGEWGGVLGWRGSPDWDGWGGERVVDHAESRGYLQARGPPGRTYGSRSGPSPPKGPDLRFCA
ncbi:hypothetical protein Atai01_16780 [Amycolatopsis taiwanensis]|uniref:Uncharacterized protein n=1 Tax=Amycolatopsis taiwanensis TaxID=342230 RepID=A0A9W6QVW4_9PSEU|nr:hypothetical protein Atai01_16780 [Amycolatopsis taiwanensis]